MSYADFEDDRRRHALQRIAALQRLREQLRQGNHAATVDAIEAMIEQEAKVIARDLDDEPA